MAVMLQTNPFSILAETISPLVMQGFIVAMVVLIALGTIIQMIHHKNLTYFFNNAKKAKLAAQHLNWVLGKEDWPTSLVCMEQFYFGLHLQF